MIKVPFPHMVSNAHNVPGEEYEMWNTWRVPRSKSADHMIDWIATVAQNAPDGKLSTVIFNAHGKPGKIKIGQGITRDDVTKFSRLKGLVDRIWIVACKVARIAGAGSITDGNYFCYRLAQESGAYVKASTATQTGITDLPIIDSIPFGYIDDWEGTVFRWRPTGELY